MSHLSCRQASSKHLETSLRRAMTSATTTNLRKRKDASWRELLFTFSCRGRLCHSVLLSDMVRKWILLHHINPIFFASNHCGKRWFNECFVLFRDYRVSERDRYFAQFEAKNDLNIEISRLSSTLPREKSKFKNARRNPASSPVASSASAAPAAQQFTFESSSPPVVTQSSSEPQYVNLQQSRSLSSVSSHLSPSANNKSSSLEDVERGLVREDEYNGNEASYGSTVFALSGIPSPSPRRSIPTNNNSNIQAASTPPSNSRDSPRVTSVRSPLHVQTQSLATTPPKIIPGRVVTSTTSSVRTHTFRMTGAITSAPAPGSPLRRAGETGSLRRAFSPTSQSNMSPSLSHRKAHPT